MAMGEGTASLDKGLAVLDLIGGSPQGVGNVELLAQAGLPKTTLYRILATLVERGLIRRDPVKRVYRLGFHYLEIVRNAYLMPDLVAAASAEMRWLRDLTGETSYLAVLDGDSVRSLERCDGAHSQRSSAALGRSKPLHCTGQGKAILSRLDPARRDTLLKSITLEALTEHTITDRRRLQIELTTVAARGYAIDDEEIVLGVRCVAAAIVDTAGEVRGALSVAGPAYRLSRARLELLGPELAEASRRVGAQLRVKASVPVNSEVEAIGDDCAFRGAFPTWSRDRHCLYWADTLAPAVHCYDGKVDRIIARLDAPITTMQWCGDRLLVGQVAGTDTQRSWLAPDGTIEPLNDASIWNDASITVLCVDDAGTCWAARRAPTTSDEAARKRRDASAVSETVQIGLIDADGRFNAYWRVGEPIDAMAWAPDGTTAYAVAPESGTILVLRKTPDGASGQASLRRLTSMPKGSGVISGVAVDRAGGIWTGLNGGWSLVRFTPDGNLDLIKSLPVAAPTGIAFAPHAKHPALYVTTDRYRQPLESLSGAPDSGKLLKVRLP